MEKNSKKFLDKKPVVLNKVNTKTDKK